MNKKLLVLALASAFVAPAAMADVTISGAVFMGPKFGTTTDGTSATAAGNTVATPLGSAGHGASSLHTAYSLMNINSTEDIGDGNKVIYNLQMDLGGHTEGGNNITIRNTSLGMAGGWGSLNFGVNEHIYERYMYLSDAIDVAAGPGSNLWILGSPGYGVIFNNGGLAAGQAGFYRRTGNSMWYDSPDIGGFTFGVGQTLNAYSTGATKPSVTSMGAQFKPADMPFYVNVAFEKHKDMMGLNVISAGNGGTGSDDTAFQFGGGATFGDISLFARFESLKYKSDGAATVTQYKRDATLIGGRYNLSTGYVGAQVAMAADGKISCTAAVANCNANESGAVLMSLVYAHNLSKQTQLLVVGSMMNNDALASYAAVGGAGGGVGSDSKVLAAFLKHSF